ncbi:MAG: translation initiation factor IF-2 [Candidatus Micrarchaeaceae archaeon]
MIRQPIICVMGHVDHGKTTLLDKIRNSTIAAKEAGGITQHIGASEVPISVVERICGPMLKAMGSKITIPGLLFIDTPGHEAFTNLRKRGGSVSDLAILVVDITKGFEPQTIEAINILRGYKTPFIVAANKVDLITGWNSVKTSSIMESLKKQNSYVNGELDEKMYGLMGKLGELGFSSDRFDNVKDFKAELAIVPLSAKTGEGIAELLMLVTGLSQRFLEMKLSIEVNGPGKGSILERKEITGLGTTIDVILYDGSLHVNDTIAFATPDSVATAKIKALLKPKPLHEMRESTSKFTQVESAYAASGIKISGNGLDEALPGSPVIQVLDNTYAEQIKAEIGDVFAADDKGVVLKADSIGSIEALARLLKSENFSISKKGLGEVTKRDVLDAFSMHATDPKGAVVIAFNVGIDGEAADTARYSGIKIIEGNIIYKIIDDYKAYVEEMDRLSREQTEKDVIFPAEIHILRGSCFRVSHPAIFGMTVVSGRVKPGDVIMNSEGEVIGRVKGIQNDKLPVDTAKKGDSMAMSMDEPTFGRQIKDEDVLYTRVRDNDEKLLLYKAPDLLDDEEKALLNKIIDIKKRARGEQ